MKVLIKSIVIICLLAINNRSYAQPGTTVSFQVFYDNLSPYGQWIQDPQYGYAWIPYAENDFRPYYTDGYWVMTQYGNTWVSDYPWGWACFHYGRWTYDPYYGWVWIPGMEWAPAWVAWRYGYGYYGWAPLGPGIFIGYSFGNYYCPYNWWVFIPPHYIHHRHFHQHWHPRDNNTIINKTRILSTTETNPINKTRYIPGPTSTEIQKETNQPVPVYRAENTSRPGAEKLSGNTLNIYNPMLIKATDANGAKISPAHAIAAPQPVGKPQPVGTENRSSFREAHPLPSPQKQQPTTPVIQERPKQQPSVPARPQQQPPVQQRPQPGHFEPPKQYNPPVQRPVPSRPYQPPVQRPQPSRPYNPPPVQRPSVPRPAPQRPSEPSRQAPQQKPANRP